jgi:NAD(P)-dependent dehydrogenase (short-subunit alcohol dehydrogenase family)
MASFIAGGRAGIYNTAKFAVRGLSYSLRHSMYQYGIGVSVVHPGLVKSYIYASDDVRPDTSRAR